MHVIFYITNAVIRKTKSLEKKITVPKFASTLPLFFLATPD